MANNGIYYSSGNSLNFTTNNTTWATITSGGTFQMSAVSATTYYNLPSATFTGGTVTGATNFTGGLTANTISATTYLNLPPATFTGGTVSGATNFTGGLTANTISATTYQNLPGSSSANCVTTFFVTNISGCSPVNMLSPLNVQDGLSVTGTSTFTSQANFTGGLSASTFSANTYQNLPSFNSAQINGTPQFSGDTNNFINFSGINITITSAATNTLVFSAATGGGGAVSSVTAGSGLSGNSSTGTIEIINTDKGSSQNIFKNIQVNGATQFSAGSNSSDLNFSGINITITSAATNTLVFSAATGGGGGVTQIIAGTNITISPTGGTGNVTINSTASGGTSSVNLGTVYTTANNFNFL